ncbi:45561_t:CDS:2 [Gigaspora margarita]|uniref:45561_t:CDS:1 n=1 Tax=Gigaspora margarita TaxID=4874 RepID=A0ABM8W666_GIGMA|nr:45561_t:CDS:2 [Gigaspora margarita]
MKIDCQRVKEIDIFENFEGYLILIQCKNYTDTKISIDEIRAFEGMMSRYPKNTTIGIYVTFVTDGYSRLAIKRAESSKLNLLLTNVSNMHQDILNYMSKKLGKDSEEENYIIEEIIFKAEEEVHAMNEDHKRRIANLEKKVDIIIENQKKIARKIEINQSRIMGNQNITKNN